MGRDWVFIAFPTQIIVLSSLTGLFYFTQQHFHSSPSPVTIWRVRLATVCCSLCHRRFTNTGNGFRSAQWLHIICLDLHRQPDVRGWRPGKCTFGCGPVPSHLTWQVLLTAKHPDHVDSNQSFNMREIHISLVFHVQTSARLHVTQGLPIVTDYWNKESQSPNIEGVNTTMLWLSELTTGGRRRIQLERDTHIHCSWLSKPQPSFSICVSGMLLRYVMNRAVNQVGIWLYFEMYTFILKTHTCAGSTCITLVAPGIKKNNTLTVARVT